MPTRDMLLTVPTISIKPIQEEIEMVKIDLKQFELIKRCEFNFTVSNDLFSWIEELEERDMLIQAAYEEDHWALEHSRYYM